MKNKYFFSFLLAMLMALPLSAQVRELQLWRGGVVIHSIATAQIDSVKFAYALSAPTAVNAQLKGTQIQVSWPVVNGATAYEVYRSGDGQKYSSLGRTERTLFVDEFPLAGTNYYKVRSYGYKIESQLSVASAPISFGESNEMETGLYMGVLGFNETLIDKGSMSLLTPDTKGEFVSFVDGLTTNKNTLLYYGVDKGLDKITSTALPGNLTNVAIVTFTDGLDQGSLPMVDYKYATRDEYRDYLKGRIKSTEVQGLPLTAYSIGLRGGDVTDYTAFTNNLKSLASQEDFATEVNNMSDVNQRFQDIANQLIKVTKTQTLSIKFPKLDDGQVYRFTFDNVTNAANSKVYIEGTLNARNNMLNNIKYVGLTCNSGTSLQGTADGALNVVFEFENIKAADGELLSLDYVNEYYYTGGYWQVNSEFDKGEDLQEDVKRSSAAIMLVLDCSSSLQSNGDKFTEMKKHVKSFIETLAQAVEDNADTGGGSTPGTGGSASEPKVYTVNGVSFKMIPVEGGTFTMGATAEQGSDAVDDEKPKHQVTLSSYAIGETEVTQELWEAVMGSNPSNFSGNQLPVECVSWNDCQTFITKLNQLTGVNFRLPTEAEWEFAARGGNKRSGYKYAGSNTIGNVAWYSGNSSSKPHAVAQKLPNELGLYDMSGNMHEWCQDWYGSYSSAAQTNPTGPASGSARVVRGGGWDNAAEYCRVSFRVSGTPSTSYDLVGLRLAH